MDMLLSYIATVVEFLVALDFTVRAHVLLIAAAVFALFLVYKSAARLGVSAQGEQ
jgi:hypothetical protein